MKRHPQDWVICVTALIVFSAQAGTVEQATIIADPQMQVKDGAVQGCGYRLKSIPKTIAGMSSIVLLDTSFNMYSTGFALLKGGAVQVSIKDGQLGQARTKQAESFWLKVRSDKPTTAANGKLLAAATKGYLLYGISPESVARLFAGIEEGAPITVGVRIKGEAIDRIYTGVAQLSDLDREQGRQCLGDLIKQIESDPDLATKPAGR